MRWPDDGWQEREENDIAVAEDEMERRAYDKREEEDDEQRACG
jgi:hypothetical protein